MAVTMRWWVILLSPERRCVSLLQEATPWCVGNGILWPKIFHDPTLPLLQVAEMKTFKDHVIQLHKELNDSSIKVAVALECMGGVLAQNLPSAHEHSDQGVVQPSNPERHLVSLPRHCTSLYILESLGLSNPCCSYHPRARPHCCLPLFCHVLQVGESANVPAVSAAAKAMTAKLSEEVLQPLDKWVAAYRATKDKNHR